MCRFCSLCFLLVFLLTNWTPNTNLHSSFSYRCSDFFDQKDIVTRYIWMLLMPLMLCFDRKPRTFEDTGLLKKHIRNSPKKPYCTFLTKNTPRQKYANQHELLSKLGIWCIMMHSLRLWCLLDSIRPRLCDIHHSRFPAFRVSHLGCPTLPIFIF